MWTYYFLSWSLCTTPSGWSCMPRELFTFLFCVQAISSKTSKCQNSALFHYLSIQEYEELHVHALLVMSNCLEDVESMELIQSTGGLEKLLAFAAESALPDVQMHAAKAMARAAKNGR